MTTTTTQSSSDAPGIWTRLKQWWQNEPESIELPWQLIFQHRESKTGNLENLLVTDEHQFPVIPRINEHIWLHYRPPISTHRFRVIEVTYDLDEKIMYLEVRGWG